MILGITDTLRPSLKFYLEWIGGVVTEVEVVLLSCVRQNLSDLDRCDSLVLTGGGDIHPKFYGREDAMQLVNGVNESRDEYEFALIRRALGSNLPILGICRGMQVFNVALGGTMIPDVQTAGYRNHSKEKDSTIDPRHGVRIEEHTILHSIARTQRGEVNTNHHQAVDNLAHDLRVTAWSPDGLVEGLEWRDPDQKPFLQLVEWHPERMVDFENPLSRGLIERFVSEVQSSKRL